MSQLLFLLLSFSQPDTAIEVDWILTNGKIYTVDSAFSIVEAMAIDDGRIVETGSTKNILSKYTAYTVTDLEKKSVYPGFIDAHCHFLNYGIEQSYTLLYDTKSYLDVVEKIKKHVVSKTGGWVIGRGWDQNDWEIKEFPDNKPLNELFPNTPVYLMRVDGHAAIANARALELAGINEHTVIAGGIVEVKNGKCTGILIDNAMTLIEKKLPVKSKTFIQNALMTAQDSCFSKGLTSVHEAGLDAWEISNMRTLTDAGVIKMRIYAMINPGEKNFDFIRANGIIHTDYFHVNAFKYYADGALGSRGAALLNFYSDDPSNKGLIFYSYDSLLQEAQKVYDLGFQMCTHAIGDSANRLVLNVYGEILKQPNDYRWRIEHCQVVETSDVKKFKQYSIIPSVQPTHATSDMEWADERLGADRIKYAYAYKTLLKQNNLVANGSDFPVESINPLFGFYAAVTRKDQKGNPTAGFQKENALTRTEALKGMTIWAAYAAFEENEKGSLEAGKFADFVILDKDIMTIPENELFKPKVLSTVVGGQVIYGKL